MLAEAHGSRRTSLGAHNRRSCRDRTRHRACRLDSAARARQIPSLVLIGDPAVLAARARALGLTRADCRTLRDRRRPRPFPACAARAPRRGPSREWSAGRPDPSASPLITRSIECAVRLAQAGAARAVVTNPIAKAVLYGAGFAFPGHTEFLAALASPKGNPLHPVMMLASRSLRVVPVTIHVPLKDVPAC